MKSKNSRCSFVKYDAKNETFILEVFDLSVKCKTEEPLMPVESVGGCLIQDQGQAAGGWVIQYIFGMAPCGQRVWVGYVLTPNKRMKSVLSCFILHPLLRVHIRATWTHLWGETQNNRSKWTRSECILRPAERDLWPFKCSSYSPLLFGSILRLFTGAWTSWLFKENTFGAHDATMQ